MEHVFIIIILIIGFPAVIYFAQKQEADLRRDIRSHIAYSIGTITDYVGGNRGMIGKIGRVTASNPKVKITFKTHNSKIETTSKGLLSSKMRDCVGKDYVVVYDSVNPENCILLFYYPVKDSTDFAKYIEEFKINPPSLEFKD